MKNMINKKKVNYKNKINCLKIRQSNIINIMINLHKLLDKLKFCAQDTTCKCAGYILDYNVIYKNQLDIFCIKKKQFQNRHTNYIYKIEKILGYYYKELKNSEKELFKISINNSTEISSVFDDLLELGKSLINE